MSAQTWEGPHVSEAIETIPGTAEAGAGGTRRRGGTGLSGMLLPELKQLAGCLGIKGVGGMRKSQLIDAIKAAQGGGQSSNQGGNQPVESGSQASRSGGRTGDATANG